MADFIIGMVLMAGLLLLADYTRKRRIVLTWWQWILTLLGFAYTAFVLEIITEFLQEGSPRGALVMGLITGIFAVIWAVLMGRFVFFKKQD